MLLAALLLAVLSPALSSTDTNHTKSKRQIFREQVVPHAGGKIPDDAFRSDRLALNRLNKEGIAVPDGVLLEARHRESHFGSHRNDPDIQASIVRLVQRPDGRYAPPEGRYPFNNLVESTYVIRPPINTPIILVPPHRPLPTTLRLPARPFFHHDEEPYHSTFNSIDSTIEFFNAFNAEFPGTRLWASFANPVHDVPNRILRQANHPDLEDFIAQNTNLATRVFGKQGGMLPRAFKSSNKEQEQRANSLEDVQQGRQSQPGGSWQQSGFFYDNQENSLTGPPQRTSGPTQVTLGPPNLVNYPPEQNSPANQQFLPENLYQGFQISQDVQRPGVNIQKQPQKDVLTNIYNQQRFQITPQHTSFVNHESNVEYPVDTQHNVNFGSQQNYQKTVEIPPGSLLQAQNQIPFNVPNYQKEERIDVPVRNQHPGQTELTFSSSPQYQKEERDVSTLNQHQAQGGFPFSVPHYHKEERIEVPPGNLHQVQSEASFNSPHFHEQTEGDRFAREPPGDQGQEGKPVHFPSEGPDNSPHHEKVRIQRPQQELHHVLQDLEPHEVVKQISASTSIEHEYPGHTTIPETNFICQGATNSMVPDPETSCQAFHLCNPDGTKESFLCPKGSRYDKDKQLCASWTEVPCSR